MVYLYNSILNHIKQHIFNHVSRALSNYVKYLCIDLLHLCIEFLFVCITIYDISTYLVLNTFTSCYFESRERNRESERARQRDLSFENSLPKFLDKEARTQSGCQL